MLPFSFFIIIIIIITSFDYCFLSFVLQISVFNALNCRVLLNSVGVSKTKNKSFISLSCSREIQTFTLNYTFCWRSTCNVILSIANLLFSLIFNFILFLFAQCNDSHSLQITNSFFLSLNKRKKCVVFFVALSQLPLNNSNFNQLFGFCLLTKLIAAWRHRFATFDIFMFESSINAFEMEIHYKLELWSLCYNKRTTLNDFHLYRHLDHIIYFFSLQYRKNAQHFKTAEQIEFSFILRHTFC